jgi:hypothetical protein
MVMGVRVQLEGAAWKPARHSIAIRSPARQQGRCSQEEGQ